MKFLKYLNEESEKQILDKWLSHEKNLDPHIHGEIYGVILPFNLVKSVFHDMGGKFGVKYQQKIVRHLNSLGFKVTEKSPPEYGHAFVAKYNNLWFSLCYTEPMDHYPYPDVKVYKSYSNLDNDGGRIE